MYYSNFSKEPSKGFPMYVEMPKGINTVLALKVKYLTTKKLKER